MSVFFTIDSQSESACRIFVEHNSRTSANRIEPGRTHASRLRHCKIQLEPQEGSAVEIMQC